MPRYRFYLIDDDGRVTGRHEIQYLDDDLAVTGAAEEFPGENVEIWNGAHCVLAVGHDEVLVADAALHRPVSIVV